MTYDAREKSQYSGSPVELYLFACGSTWWTFTSAGRAQTFLSHSFTPEAITRGEIDASDEDQQGSLEVTLPRSNDVAQLFVPDLPPRPVTLTLYRFHLGDSEVVQLWSGEISRVEFSGSVAKLTGLPVGRVLRKQLPSTSFQGQCNWALFSAQCGLSKGSYKQTATVSAIGAGTLTAAAFATHADGYFTGGWVESASGETHWVTAHSGSTLTLQTPFRSLATGESVDAYPGCDRTIAACKAFGNLRHYCGFPFIPAKNPFTAGIA